MKRVLLGLLTVSMTTAAFFDWAYSENSIVGDERNVFTPNITSNGQRTIADGKGKSLNKSNAPYTGATVYKQTTATTDEALKQRTNDVATCIRLQRQKRIANSLLEQPTHPENDYVRSRVDQNLEMASAQIDKLESQGACAGLDLDSLTGAIYPLLLDMARQGDAEAADCYVAADFELSENQLKPDQVEQYRQNAATLIAAQMERGDWRIVELMESANDRDGDPHRGRYTWFREISAGNPALAYRYNRLLRFGATQQYGVKLDRALQERKAELNPTQIAEQDIWAENEYKAHFAHSPPIDEYVPTCKLHSDTRVFHNNLR